jgi:hypothetical protein
MSPDPYGQAFKQEIDLRKWDLTTHRTAGMHLLEKNGRLLLASIDASTPAARIARWRTHLRGAWLVSINGTPVEESITDVSTTLAQHATSPHPCILVFSHPETSEMQLNYRAGVGELIWAMTTCHLDLAFASVKLSQSNSCPHKIHYHGLKQALKYLNSSKEDGLYFWRTSPRMDLPDGPLPPIHSNKQDLLLDNRPEHNASVLLAYADSDWATCVKTRRSFGGSCLQIAVGAVAYKTQFQPTIAGSSTEAEYMSAYFTVIMILFV